jgi:hypothetical protein
VRAWTGLIQSSTWLYEQPSASRGLCSMRLVTGELITTADSLLTNLTTTRTATVSPVNTSGEGLALRTVYGIRRVLGRVTFRDVIAALCNNRVSRERQSYLLPPKGTNAGDLRQYILFWCHLLWQLTYSTFYTVYKNIFNSKRSCVQPQSQSLLTTTMQGVTSCHSLYGQSYRLAAYNLPRRPRRTVKYSSTN